MSDASVGRPKKPLDYEIIKKLATIHCTQQEIADFFNVSTRTLQNDAQFMEIYSEAINNGRLSLRRLQWQKAEKGNVVMLIWLGKQYLGQRDKIDTIDETGETKLDELINSIKAIKNENK